MARAYLIGGAPRVGKSTLALRVLEHHHFQPAATDAIRSRIRKTTTPAAKPALFYLDSLNADETEMTRLMEQETDRIVAAANAESAAVWPAVQAWVESQLANGKDVLVEGVAVLPELVSKLTFPHSAVFLGNQSPEHAAVIQEYARNHPDSWLGSLQPDTITAFARFSRAASLHAEREAHRFRLPYVEIDQDFESALESAQKLLLNKPLTK